MLFRSFLGVVSQSRYPFFLPARPLSFRVIGLAPYLSYPFRQDFPMWDPVSFVVIVVCKTLQYVLANLLVMMVVIMALSKR